MARIAPNTAREFLKAHLSESIRWRLDGSLELTASNILVNYAHRRFSEGEPEGFAISEGLAEKIVAHHINVSRPGFPQRRHMHRQTTAPVSTEEDSWEMQGGHVSGVTPGPHTDDRKPDTPRVLTAPSSTRGFAAGTYGYAYGYQPEGGGLTTFTAFRYFELGPNEIPAIPVPESFPAGVGRWVLAMTRRNAGPETALIQRRIPLSAIRGQTEVHIRGPRRNGGRPPQNNESGMKPSRPRRGSDVRIRPRTGHQLRRGTYRLFLQLVNERGASFLSEGSAPIVVDAGTISEYAYRNVSQAKPLKPSDETPNANERAVTSGGERYVININSSIYTAPASSRAPGVYEVPSARRAVLYRGYVFIVEPDETVIRRDSQIVARSSEKRTVNVRKGAGIHCRTPDIVRKNPTLRYTYYVQYEAPGGGVTWYRVYPKLRRTGARGYFGGEQDSRGIWVYGYAPDKEPAGLYHGLVEEEPPEEDSSVLEPPDTTTVPDEATPTGVETLPQGKYLVSVTGVTESGALTRTSEPSEITLNGTQILDVTPRWTGRVNELENPQFERVDANGVPRRWTFTGVGPNEAGEMDVSAGVLTLSLRQSTSSLVSALSDPIPASAESVFTVGGNLEVLERISGEARVILREYDAAGTLTAANTMGLLTSNGHVPFVVTVTDLRADTDHVRLFCSVPGSVLGNANLKARFYNLRVLSEGCDIRKIEFSDEVDNFDPPVEKGVSANSYVGYGVPPEVTGRIVEAKPPLEIVDFENDHWPSSWTHRITGTITQNERNRTGAIHGSNGWRLADADNAASVRYYDKSYTNTGSIANRFLVRVDRMPTQGHITLGYVGSPTQRLAILRLYPNGSLRLMKYHPNLDTYAEQAISWNIRAGDVLDLEIIIGGGGTTNAIIAVGVGRNGSNRVIAFEQGGFDYRRYQINTVAVGVAGVENAACRWTLSFDQVVITRSGDILDRERPAPPADYVSPPPDRPTNPDGSYREIDPDEELINQSYVLVERGTTAVAPYIEPEAVKPGLTYTLGLYARAHAFEDGESALKVFLEGDDAQSYEAASVTLTDGPTAPGASEWRELWATFDVPEWSEANAGLYTTARFELTLQSGVYVLQEPLFHEGALPTRAERDGARSYERATQGEVSVVLPSKPPAYGAGVYTGYMWSGFGIEQATDETPEGSTSLERYYATSTDNALFSEETTDPDLVLLDEPYLRLRAVLNGDGRYTPVIAPGGMYLQTWTAAGVLLREDGSHFPGVARVDMHLYSVSVPDHEVASIGGHHQTLELSEDIERLYDFSIHVHTEDAAREIEELSLREPLVVATPFTNGEVAGRQFTVRLREQARFERENIPARILGDESGSYPVLYAVHEVEECEVLEAAPQPAPLSWADGA